MFPAQVAKFLYLSSTTSLAAFLSRPNEELSTSATELSPFQTEAIEAVQKPGWESRKYNWYAREKWTEWERAHNQWQEDRREGQKHVILWRERDQKNELRLSLAKGRGDSDEAVKVEWVVYHMDYNTKQRRVTVPYIGSLRRDENGWTMLFYDQRPKSHPSQSHPSHEWRLRATDTAARIAAAPMPTPQALDRRSEVVSLAQEKESSNSPDLTADFPDLLKSTSAVPKKTSEQWPAPDLAMPTPKHDQFPALVRGPSGDTKEENLGHWPALEVSVGSSAAASQPQAFTPSPFHGSTTIPSEGQSRSASPDTVELESTARDTVEDGEQLESASKQGDRHSGDEQMGSDEPMGKQSEDKQMGKQSEGGPVSTQIEQQGGFDSNKDGGSNQRGKSSAWSVKRAPQGPHSPFLVEPCPDFVERLASYAKEYLLPVVFNAVGEAIPCTVMWPDFVMRPPVWWSVQPYGSLATGFASPDSDADIGIFLQDYQNWFVDRDDLKRDYALSVLNVVSARIEAVMNNAEILSAKLNGRIPCLEVREAGLKAEVCVHWTQAALENTRGCKIFLKSLSGQRVTLGAWRAVMAAATKSGLFKYQQGTGMNKHWLTVLFNKWQDMHYALELRNLGLGRGKDMQYALDLRKLGLRRGKSNSENALWMAYTFLDWCRFRWIDSWNERSDGSDPLKLVDYAKEERYFRNREALRSGLTLTWQILLQEESRVELEATLQREEESEAMGSTDPWDSLERENFLEDELREAWTQNAKDLHPENADALANEWMKEMARVKERVERTEELLKEES